MFLLAAARQVRLTPSLFVDADVTAINIALFHVGYRGQT